MGAKEEIKKLDLGNWVEQDSSNFWKPTNPQDEIMGELKAIREDTYGSVYDLEQADGSVVSLPSHKVLLNKLSNAKIGDIIKVVFEGEELPKIKGYKPTKKYTVFIKGD